MASPERVSLRYGDCRAEVLLRGGQICSLRGSDGREAIWQADPAVWPQHAPVLFPVCGSVKNEQVTIAGKTYPMKKHGFTRNAPFQVAKLGDDFVELVLEPTEESRAMYPFDFVLHVTYSLFENGYTTTFLVENRSECVMPFCVGGHPAFICPMEEYASFTDYQLVFPEKESGRVALAPGGGLIDGAEILPDFRDGQILPLRHELFDERDALLFTELKSRSVTLQHQRSGKGLQFSFPKMEVLAVWTKPFMNANYLYLEPWHGMPAQVTESGAMEEKPFATLLEPGRCYKTWFTATLLK